MKEFFKKLGEKEGELSESELDMVAGGKSGGEVAVSIWWMGTNC
jgi:hypothetical protein